LQPDNYVFNSYVLLLSKQYNVFISHSLNVNNSDALAGLNRNLSDAKLFNALEHNIVSGERKS
jgi:hypothetical protein